MDFGLGWRDVCVFACCALFMLWCVHCVGFVLVGVVAVCALWCFVLMVVVLLVLWCCLVVWRSCVGDVPGCVGVCCGVDVLLWCGVVCCVVGAFAFVLFGVVVAWFGSI